MAMLRPRNGTFVLPPNGTLVLVAALKRQPFTLRERHGLKPHAASHARSFTEVFPSFGTTALMPMLLASVRSGSLACAVNNTQTNEQSLTSGFNSIVTKTALRSARVRGMTLDEVQKV